MLDLQDERTGDMIITDVFYREQIYSGPYLEQAADLVAVPRRGYDLKARVGQDSFLHRGVIQGMHTPDDAFIYLRNNGSERQLTGVEKIEDVRDIISNYFE